MQQLRGTEWYHQAGSDGAAAQPSEGPTRTAKLAHEAKRRQP